MKALHGILPVAKRQKLYDRSYPRLMCLKCSEIESSDHSFTCGADADIRAEIASELWDLWKPIMGAYRIESIILKQDLDVDVNLHMSFAKGFVFREWYKESLKLFKDCKLATSKIVELGWVVVSSDAVAKKAQLGVGFLYGPHCGGT
ncbi:hypothetical protein G9A89_010287 [Geosiphon pyriformis]|nr:hypothetical protein G9A89_010287 [Geosiphon pyriformis]